MTSLIGFTAAHGEVRARRLRRDEDPEQTVEQLADILIFRCGENFRRARRLLGAGHWEVLDPSAAPAASVRAGEPIAVAGVGYLDPAGSADPLRVDLAGPPADGFETLYHLAGEGREIAVYRRGLDRWERAFACRLRPLLARRSLSRPPTRPRTLRGARR